MSDYTPTTEEVRNAYGVLRNSYKIQRFDQEFDRGYIAEFDRWLAEVKAQVWEEGYTAGVVDAHTENRLDMANPYRVENK